MALSAKQRWSVLGSALAVTLGLAAWLGNTPEEDKEEAEEAPLIASKAPPGAHHRQSGPIAAPPATPGKAPAPDEPAGEIADLFAARNWHANPAADTPPDTEAASAAPAEPVTPQLPFAYFGKLIDGRRVTIYLATADRNLAVGKGDVIDGQWRVESIGPTSMVFRYLPMGQEQSLAIGRAQ